MTAASDDDAGGVPPIDDWGRLLDGRVALVSGGGAGIGAAVVELFAAHGASVEVAKVDPWLQVNRDGIRSQVVDVTVDSQVTRFATDVLERHGRIDVLINNVGDYRPLVRFEQSDPQSWQRMYDVNLRHVLLMTRSFLPAMRDQRRGSIVNIHSVEGMRGYPGDPVYAAMKAAVAQFTASLAVGQGRFGIRVNGIGPDLTQTPQVDYLTGYEDAADLWPSWSPVGRVGRPMDQARVALFLASDLSAFVTGHNIPVDGGTLAGGGWFFSPREGRFVNRPRNL